LLARQILPAEQNILIMAAHAVLVVAVYGLTLQLIGFSKEDRSVIRQIARPVRLLISRH
jgi:hypothetical protein